MTFMPMIIMIGVFRVLQILTFGHSVKQHKHKWEGVYSYVGAHSPFVRNDLVRCKCGEEKWVEVVDESVKYDEELGAYRYSWFTPSYEDYDDVNLGEEVDEEMLMMLQELFG